MRIDLFFVSAASLWKKNKTAGFPSFTGKLAVFLLVFASSFSYSMGHLNDQHKNSLSFATNPNVSIQGEVFVYEEVLEKEETQRQRSTQESEKYVNHYRPTFKLKSTVDKKLVNKAKKIPTKTNPALFSSSLHDECFFLRLINRANNAIINFSHETYKAYSVLSSTASLLFLTDLFGSNVSEDLELVCKFQYRRNAARPPPPLRA
ncbi:MAG TPA: hypothetical protein DCQ50_09680 [Chryseobacterium sp.]|nr:hypothetical protein [Chryseobacterium sp.]